MNQTSMIDDMTMGNNRRTAAELSFVFTAALFLFVARATAIVNDSDSISVDQAITE